MTSYRHSSQFCPGVYIELEFNGGPLRYGINVKVENSALPCLRELSVFRSKVLLYINLVEEKIAL